MEKLGPGDPSAIGAYRLLARLGAGGMGRVYLARSDRGRTVAVKLVRAELAEREEFRARFRQEVHAARRVGGYWTAPVLDADTEAPVPWVATGYVAGPSLQRVVGHDHGALPERSVRILAAGLAQALRDIHAAGIVHRDLKPSNVLVTIDGPRVIDFGIARALESSASGVEGLTRTGALVGSPGFMAPEQVRGDRITPACDVFCLGSVLAYAATGSLPFGTADSGVHALMFRIAQEEPDLTGVPEGVADLVRDCLRKDPANRPSLEAILERTGVEDTVTGGRSRDPWLPSALVAQLGRHAVRLLEAESPEEDDGTTDGSHPGAAPAGTDTAGPGWPAGAGGAAGPGTPPGAGWLAGDPGGPGGWDGHRDSGRAHAGGSRPGGGHPGAGVAGAGWPAGAGGTAGPGVPAGPGTPPGPGALAGPGAPAGAGTPHGSGTSAGPDAPYGQGTPAGPGTPHGPGTPAGPWTPPRPEAPAGPREPAGPDTPHGPGTPAGPGTPPGPGVAAGAGWPAGPGVPPGPEASAGAAFSAGPGTPSGPGTSAGPGAPAGPYTPPGPGAPAGPGTPPGPGTPVGTGWPAGPETPAGPGTPSASTTPTASAVSGGAGGPYRGPVVDGSPEHAPVSDGGASAPGSHLPLAATPRTPPAAPPAYGAPQPQPHPQHPHPAYGYPQQTGAGAWGGARQAPAYQPYAGGLGSTPPYGPPDAGPPAEPERRSGRSTALLVAIALVVALGAGGSVYALMKNGSGTGNQGSGPVPTHAATPRDGSAAPTATSAAPTPSTSRTSAAGSVPDAYLGTWRTTLGNAGGTGTRELTIRQGEVGDTVLTLVADGPAESGGSYHCVFEAELAEAPAGDGPLAIGPSTVTTGEPASSCTPGEATEITLLPDGRLKRAKASGGESLTYSKE